MNFFSMHDTNKPLSSGIKVEAIREDVPKFERVYSGKLDNRCSIKITIRTFMNDRWPDGELTQPNGNWVSFDPKNIAEKILDPILVPLVQASVNEILKADHAFIRTDPKEFTDEHCSKWQRVTK